MERNEIERGATGGGRREDGRGMIGRRSRTRVNVRDGRVEFGASPTESDRERERERRARADRQPCGPG